MEFYGMFRFVMKQFVWINILRITTIKITMSEENHWSKNFMNNKTCYIVQVPFTNFLLRLQNYKNCLDHDRFALRYLDKFR